MKKGIIAAGLTTLALLLSGCNIKFGSKKAKATIMVYMCGSDLESGYDGYHTNVQYAGMGSADILEMCQADNKPKDVNVIIQTGGSKAWKNSKISAKKSQRWYIKDGALQADSELTLSNMGKASTFQDFLEWGLKKYPAEKTGVIMWNHGGAMQGVCSDENFSGDTLLADEVTTALEGAFKNTKRKEKLEWIGYDACLMAVQDIAEKNSDYFNYMVSAQESEAGSGWKYNAWLRNLYEGKSTEEVLSSICDSFVASVGSISSKSNDQTLSVLNLNKMAKYKEEFESLAGRILEVVPSSQKKAFQNTGKQAKTYGTDVYTLSDLQEAGLSTNPSSSYYYENYGFEKEGNLYYLYGYSTFGVLDLVDFLDNIENQYSSLSSDIAKVKAAYNDMLVHNTVGKGAGNSNGLCLFFPMNQMCHSSTYYSAKQTRFTNWRNVTLALGENK